MDGALGADYRDKIKNLENEEKQDRFMYQELVRRTHAERIKYWILSEYNPAFPNELAVVNEIKKLLGNIDPLFKRDLAIICERHHLSDLDDHAKYKPDQQYGPTTREVVNVQYSALLLRTADLLHITSDRTPSIEFNLINPTDPVSQEEWAKQSSVKAVRPQSKKNKEGQIDIHLQKDSFEVIALFEDESGFFGLIAYLNYANKELRQNFELNEATRKLFHTKFEYPWKSIDDSNIETKDFDKRQFEFILDQTRILDLLIGHTLYNDSTVVLRELTQNAIDATKLKKFELEQSGISGYSSEIKVVWSEKLRELSFIDNGTGMTLEIIQNHLLKVGSSRYQDEAFKKKYPDFSSISRFGIGLLTCFLIADDIDIITKSADQEKGILLKIKKVHGKYLLKYLPADKMPVTLKEHGTVIKLFIRSDVDLTNIEGELKKWILIPNCKLSLENNDVVTQIGFENVAEALKQGIEDAGYKVDNSAIKVVEVHKDGIELAYALRYVEHWKEWEFLDYNSASLGRNHNTVGICIEGIKVDFNTPGFKGKTLFALANTSGKNAPKTNVARSTIEVTPEKHHLLSKIYLLYLEHISNELSNLRSLGFSITWATHEANWILDSIVRSARARSNGDSGIEDVVSFHEALSKINCVLIERNEKRDVISINELKGLNHFWTIDCASYSSADSLLREVKSSNTSALTLLNNIFDVAESNTSHIDILLCNSNKNKFIEQIISNSFQVSSIKIIPEQRRLDLKWSLVKTKIWEEIDIEKDDFSNSKITRCYLQLEEIELDESINQTAIHSSNTLYILKNSELNLFLVTMVNNLSARSREDVAVISRIIMLINHLFYYKSLTREIIEESISVMFDRKNFRDLGSLTWDKVQKEDLISAIMKTNFVKYDTTIWFRRDYY